MREIKFRAWVRGEMIKVFSLLFRATGPHTDQLHMERITLVNDMYELGLGDAVLMQFTGLHDKNGKEIYEGYIVTYYGHAIPMRVQWEENEASFYPFNVLHPTGLDGEYLVIGNIYENPEFLEKK